MLSMVIPIARCRFANKHSPLLRFSAKLPVGKPRGNCSRSSSVRTETNRHARLICIPKSAARSRNAKSTPSTLAKIPRTRGRREIPWITALSTVKLISNRNVNVEDETTLDVKGKLVSKYQGSSRTDLSYYRGRTADRRERKERKKVRTLRILTSAVIA